MTLRELESLARSGHLKAEAPNQAELDALVASGAARLIDAKNSSLSTESRFDLAYGAAHAFCRAALRWHGYRTDQR